MEILKTQELYKEYGKGESLVRALNGVSLTVEKGESVAVVGTSGSGKSTLLHILGGLDEPSSGKVWINGSDLATLGDEELTIFRRRNIGFVFQNYNLIPMLNVMENIILPLKLDGATPDGDYLATVIDALGLNNKVKSLPNQLSGGQQQRVAIARALLTKPALILADEPTGNLDSRTSQDVLALLKTTCGRFHQTLMMITHDEEIAQTANRLIRIEDGKIREGGCPHGQGQQ